MFHQVARFKGVVRAPLFKLMNGSKVSYHCEICDYQGPFRDKSNARKRLGNRLPAKCPVCSSMERQRFQCHLLNQLLDGRQRSEMSILHFSPEPCLERLYRKQFGDYLSADLLRKNVDRQVDVQEMPFANDHYDVILISHVLQYVPNDEKALAELARVLKPGGIVLAPVPLLHESTVRRDDPDPSLKMISEPGLDYFERYEQHFHKAELHHSNDYPDKFHFFRELRESHAFPLGRADGHYADIIPVCYKI